MAQGTQELRHLSKTGGQVVQVSSQTNQHHHQTGGDEEAIHESYQLATSDHLSHNLEDEDF